MSQYCYPFPLAPSPVLSSQIGNGYSLVQRLPATHKLHFQFIENGSWSSTTSSQSAQQAVLLATSLSLDILRAHKVLSMDHLKQHSPVVPFMAAGDSIHNYCTCVSVCHMYTIRWVWKRRMREAGRNPQSKWKIVVRLWEKWGEISFDLRLVINFIVANSY